MYKGCPLPIKAVISKSQLGPEPALKLIAVTGSNKIDEAKIGGITPAVFIFKGRWLLSP